LILAIPFCLAAIIAITVYKMNATLGVKDNATKKLKQVTIL
jgi:hypothetical protein